MNYTNLFLKASYEQGKGLQIVIKWFEVMYLLQLCKGRFNTTSLFN